MRFSSSSCARAAALRLGVADGREPALEVRVRRARGTSCTSATRRLDVLAHRFERRMSRVGREAGERLLEAEPRLRVREAGEHAHLLVAQAGDLVLERDQVPLGGLGLVGELGRARPSAAPPRRRARRGAR